MQSRINPSELHLNKANSFDTEAPFWTGDLTLTNSIVSNALYDKLVAFNIEIVNFPFLCGNVPCSPSFCESMR